MAACLGVAVPQESLTDASRREAQRRATVSRAARVLTNADLDPERQAPSVIVESSAAASIDVAPSSLAGMARVAAPEPARPGDVVQPRASGHHRTAADEEWPAGAPEVAPGPPDAAEPRVRGEPWWRARAEALSIRRDRLGEQQRAMQNRIDMLAAEIAGRDDPFQRLALEDERRRAIEEHEALGRDLIDLGRAVSDFHESARRLVIPADWIRAAPD
jgi:hypothetical protein